MAQDVFLSMLYLGNAADIDTFEGNLRTENEADLFGTYGSAGDPLHGHILNVESDSPTGYIDADHDTGNGTLTYDAGGGTVTVGLDSMVTYHGTVTYADGSTENMVIDVLQTTNGDLLMPAWDSYTQYGAKAIESVTLNSVEYDDWAGFQQSSYDSVQFVCFATGTRISLPSGQRPVELLMPGDIVSTVDHGPLPIVWIGRRRLRFPPAPDRQKPIEIKPGALGPDHPRQPLVVSPQHRVLMTDADSGDAGACLVAAQCLTGLPRVRHKAGCRSVTYHALLLPRHAVIWAESVAVESFYPGPVGLATLAPFDRLSLVARLPAGRALSAYGPTAYPVLANRKARTLIAARRLRVPKIPAARQIGVGTRIDHR